MRMRALSFSQIKKQPIPVFLLKTLPLIFDGFADKTRMEHCNPLVFVYSDLPRRLFRTPHAHLLRRFFKVA
jgi:hypothetical protein